MGVPREDVPLMNWSSNFGSRVSENPEMYGIAPEIAAQFMQLQESYSIALRETQEPGQWSKSSTTIKREMKQALLDLSRKLYRVVQGMPTLDEGEKVLVGVGRPSNPTPTHPPASVPALYVRSVNGRTVDLLLNSREPGSRRRRPSDATGAVIFTYVGEQAPPNISDWTFSKMTGRMKTKVTFGLDLPPGTKVWFSAAWFNNKKQLGMGSDPIFTHLQYGTVMMAA